MSQYHFRLHMAKLSYQTCVNFNQSYHFDDLKKGGNCFAYIELFISYILAHRALYANLAINYGGLKNVLNECKNKKELQASQSHFLTRMYNKCDHKMRPNQNFKILFDIEIAPLNKNTRYETSLELSDICQIICDDIKFFTKPTLYFLNIYDNTQRIYELSHDIALYLASPRELHFFDANSGLHIIHLHKNVTKESLKETLLELIFKKNIFFRIWCNAHSPHIEYELNSSREPDRLYKYQAHLQQIIRDHLVNANDLDNYLKDCDELNKDEQGYVRRLADMIKIIRQIHFDEKTNPYKTFDYLHPEHPHEEIELQTFVNGLRNNRCL